VSRVWFELTDKAAFDQCIQLSLEWMADRARTVLPKEAWEGQTFDVTDILGANPTKGVRINAVGQNRYAVVPRGNRRSHPIVLHF
jgi:hypothetical protein